MKKETISHVGILDRIYDKLNNNEKALLMSVLRKATLIQQDYDELHKNYLQVGDTLKKTRLLLSLIVILYGKEVVGKVKKYTMHVAKEHLGIICCDLMIEEAEEGINLFVSDSRELKDKK